MAALRQFSSLQIGAAHAGFIDSTEIWKEPPTPVLLQKPWQEKKTQGRHREFY